MTRRVTTPICRLYRPFWTQKNDGNRPPRKGKRKPDKKKVTKKELIKEKGKGLCRYNAMQIHTPL